MTSLCDMLALSCEKFKKKIGLETAGSCFLPSVPIGDQFREDRSPSFFTKKSTTLDPQEVANMADELSKVAWP